MKTLLQSALGMFAMGFVTTGLMASEAENCGVDDIVYRTGTTYDGFTLKQGCDQVVGQLKRVKLQPEQNGQIQALPLGEDASKIGLYYFPTGKVEKPFALIGVEKRRFRLPSVHPFFPARVYENVHHFQYKDGVKVDVAKASDSEYRVKFHIPEELVQNE